MGSAQIRLCFHKNRQLIVSLLFLLVSSLTIVRLTAEGTTITRLPAAAKEAAGMEDVGLVRTETIGSRPPRCDRRCNSCGPCEAVQVPVSTILQSHKGSHFLSASVPRIVNSREDDISNYKPMSWKCKCGTLLFNP